MKIICIGRNYSEHARELGNELPEEPVFFLKPATAIHPLQRPFRIPDWSKDVHYEIELVYRIARSCSKVPQESAWSCVDAVTVGIDFTARDVQNELKKKGLPWEKAKAFDGSAVVGERFIPIASNDPVRGFRLHKNGPPVQSGDPADMIHAVPDLIAFVSRFITLLPGDLLFTGTPAGVGPVAAGDRLEGYLNEDRLFDLRVEG
jgi:acylpyruvate hydrolase